MGLVCNYYLYKSCAYLVPYAPPCLPVAVVMVRVGAMAGQVGSCKDDSTWWSLLYGEHYSHSPRAASSSSSCCPSPPPSPLVLPPVPEEAGGQKLMGHFSSLSWLGVCYSGWGVVVVVMVLRWASLSLQVTIWSVSARLP